MYRFYHAIIIITFSLLTSCDYASSDYLQYEGFYYSEHSRQFLNEGEFQMEVVHCDYFRFYADGTVLSTSRDAPIPVDTYILWESVEFDLNKESINKGVETVLSGTYSVKCDSVFLRITEKGEYSEFIGVIKDEETIYIKRRKQVDGYQDSICFHFAPFTML